MADLPISSWSSVMAAKIVNLPGAGNT